MTDKTIINNWTGGGTLQTWKSGEWQILYAKDSAGNVVTLSLNEHEAVRLAYAVSPIPNEQHMHMREHMYAVYELSYPDARADELRQIADEIECTDRCERCPADRPESGEFCGFVAADSLRKLAAALDVKAKVDVEAPAPGGESVTWGELHEFILRHGDSWEDEGVAANALLSTFTITRKSQSEERS